MSVNLYRIFTFRFWQKLEFQKATHARAFCFCLSVSRLFASDTSPKWIDREGLGKSRPRTRLAWVASVSVWFRGKKWSWKGIFGFDRARNETRTKKWKRGKGEGKEGFLPFFPTPSPLFYLRQFSSDLWLLFLIRCSWTAQKRLLRRLRDWGNLFVKSRVRYIEHLDLTTFRENYQNVRYSEV